MNSRILQVVLMLSVFFSIAGCGFNADNHSRLLDEDSELSAAMDHWRSFAQTCEGHPSKEKCDDGDALLFNALLCSSGEEAGCDAVKASQSPDGRFWRSPRRIGDNAGQDNSFSRDMSMGVLTYLVTTKDTQAAEAWLSWIKNNKQCPKHISPRVGCVLPEVAVVCDDKHVTRQSTPLVTITTTTIIDRCIITPSLWAHMNQVWEYLELDTTNAMRQNAWADKTLVEETRVTPTGYQLHLKSVATWIKEIMNIKATQRLELKDILNSRQGDNPFFTFLRDGATPTLRQRVLDICPKPGTSTNFRKHQWAWERDTSSAAWRESMGWDCIFMGNLLSGGRDVDR